MRKRNRIIQKITLERLNIVDKKLGAQLGKKVPSQHVIDQCIQLIRETKNDLKGLK